MNRWPKQFLRYVAAPLAIVLFLFLIWEGLNGWGFWGMTTAIGLLLVLAAMLYLKRMEIVSEEDVKRRIRTEFPVESQLQVLEVYRHLKVKELEGLFPKILDDAKGEPNKVSSLANLAESAGWKAFLESHW